MSYLFLNSNVVHILINYVMSCCILFFVSFPSCYFRILFIFIYIYLFFFIVLFLFLFFYFYFYFLFFFFLFIFLFLFISQVQSPIKIQLITSPSHFKSLLKSKTNSKPITFSNPYLAQLPSYPFPMQACSSLSHCLTNLITPSSTSQKSPKISDDSTKN